MAFEKPLIGFVFSIYEDQGSVRPSVILNVDADGTADAKRKAVAMAKERFRRSSDGYCTIDIAYQGDAPWNVRYIATAQYNDFTGKYGIVRLED